MGIKGLFLTVFASRFYPFPLVHYQLRNLLKPNLHRLPASPLKFFAESKRGISASIWLLFWAQQHWRRLNA